MNPNYVVIIKQDLDKFLSVGYIAPVEEANRQLYWKKTTNLKSTWIFSDSMLQPRKIRILYPLLKRFKMRLRVTRCIHFWMDFLIITKSWSPPKIGTRLHSSPIGEHLFGYSCHLGSRMLHQLINKWWIQLSKIILECSWNYSCMTSNLNTHLTKLQFCFDKCNGFTISLNLKICMFLVHSWIILGYAVSKRG